MLVDLPQFVLEEYGGLTCLANNWIFIALVLILVLGICDGLKGLVDKVVAD